nr:serine protease 33-like isoform X2 [Equus asinus]
MAGSQAPELVPQSPAVQGPCQRRPTAGRAQPHGLGRQASSWTPGTAAREPSSPQSGCSQAPAALAGRCRGQGEGWRGAPGERPPDSPPPALHSWPSSLFSVTLGPNRLALDACESTSSVEELLLSPGGPEGSGPGGLALARLERPPSLSSAVQPVSLATGPQPSPWPKLCWAQGFDLDFDPYIPPKELHSVPLKPLDVSSCKDAFRLQPDCPDLKVSLPKGSQCTRLPYSYSKLVVSDGAPLVCSQGRNWLLQGVMTWSPCLGTRLPEVYMPVYPFRSWIREKVSNATFYTLAKKCPLILPKTRKRRQ